MSKSLGNFITVHELLQQVDPQVLRLLLAATQYRHPLQYSDASLDDAQTNLQHLQTAAKNLNFRLQDSQTTAFDEGIEQQLTQLTQQFTAHMDDDFNVQNGLSDVYELMRLINRYSQQAQINFDNARHLLDRYAQLLAIFGITLKFDYEVNAQVEELIQQREAARANKNFAQSDRLRQQLRQMGIILEDTPQGTRWHKE